MPEMKVWTVLLALPDYKASDQSCAADRICRVAACAPDVPSAVIDALVNLPQTIGAEENEAWDYEPVAVYEGELTDLYNPHEHASQIQPMPEWALSPANGCWDSMAQLSTKDGRRTGNAVLFAWSWPVSNADFCTATVITDAGNVMRLTMGELEELFHPPQYIMRETLPAHRAALEEEA